MEIHKTFRYRLEPNAEQWQAFTRIAGCCRFVYNQALANRIEAFEHSGKSLTYRAQCKALTVLKHSDGTKWLAEAPAQVLQQALKDLQFAYDQFFRRVHQAESPGFPKFRKKGNKDAFRYPQDVKVENGKVFLPKIGWVKYRDSRPIEGTILQATIKREGPYWFICISCRVELPEDITVQPTDDKAVGIDVGVKWFAILSDGTKIENPRFLERRLRELRRAERKLARKEKFSKNWKRQAARIAKLHAKVKNGRIDFAHKVSTAIVKNHDVIAVESLNIKGMVMNKRLARSISDVGWGRFYSFLKYKAEWAGKHFVRIDRFLATSQVCSHCQAKKPMPLETRTFACEQCGIELDRDFNASLNIRSAGLAVLGLVPDACGGT